MADTVKNTVKTKSQECVVDVAAQLRSRCPLIWVVTKEEARVERYLFEAAASANYLPRTWDAAQGVCDMAGKVLQGFGTPDLSDALNAIRERANPTSTYASQTTAAERGVWIMRDLPAWITGLGAMLTLRQIRNLARLLPSTPRERAQAIIIISPSGQVPDELANHTTVIEWPLPDRFEIAAILDAALEALPEDMKKDAAPNGTREAAVDAAIGLSGEEAAACFARSLVQRRCIDPVVVAQEKKRVIARERVLEWYDPIPGGLDAVGGLENLKEWLVARASAFTEKARAYGLPAPKGNLLIGIPGCGKSLMAKAVATAWRVPLLKMDLGAFKGKFVGESENNLRKGLRVIEAIGRCVVWIDEIEKGLQGATSGASDGGVSADALGTILNWMQERKGEAFVIATANNVETLPPELMRKGRFDEVWWVDLPNATERVAVINAALKFNGRGKAKIDTAKIANVTNGFSGAEIAALVPDAMFKAFADGEREITTNDLIEAAKTVYPMSKSSEKKIATLREWSAGKTRPASRPETARTTKQLERVLDIT